MAAENKYARIEWERRFLVKCFPCDAVVTRAVRIADHYLEGTSLRLRRQDDGTGKAAWKLTQKRPDGASGVRQGLITTIYLTEAEFSLLAQLPARTLIKMRHSIPPFGVDVFEGELQGLMLAEAEFESAEEASDLKLPSFLGHEVTQDRRFTGGRLVRSTRNEVSEWLDNFGMRMDRIDDSLTR